LAKVFDDVKQRVVESQIARTLLSAHPQGVLIAQTMTLPQRSFLFGPANRPDRFDKALSCGADAVILDLEDAVPPESKTEARHSVAAWLSGSHRVIIRINAADTPWFKDDLALARLPGVAGIMLPKAERIDEVFSVSCIGAGTAVFPMIETAAGLNNVNTIARAQGVQRLVFGSIDFQLDLGISGDEMELLPYRTQLVMASRLARLAAPIDGVSTSIDDAQLLAADTLRSRRLGFGGKLCIHPRQVSAVNASFCATPEELAWARRVLEAAARSAGAAVAVDGKMVDRPVMMRAQAMIQEAGERALQLASAGGSQS
jgi:citrate lyase subunit beta/citryl-CoA lyase